MIHAQEISCVYTEESLVYIRDLLCMHNTLVHALGQGTQGPGPKKGAAQKISCVYTRDSFVYTQVISCA